MEKKAEVNNHGIGFFGLLGLIFIVLKLCKIISWGWVWVLSPIWIPIALEVVLVVVIFIAVKIKKE